MGDPERYRKPAEIHLWQEQDPIGIYHKFLTTHEILKDEELLQEEQKVDEEMKDAVDFAESSPEPAPETLFDDIYVEQ